MDTTTVRRSSFHEAYQRDFLHTPDASIHIVAFGPNQEKSSPWKYRSRSEGALLHRDTGI